VDRVVVVVVDACFGIGVQRSDGNVTGRNVNNIIP